MDKNWSIEAIHETAATNWSLEGDNQLLNLMKSISKNLEQRCTTSNNNLNRLMLDVDKTKIKLGNATTKLLDLNNAKFVEHTVMDMDSIVSNAEKASTVDNNDKIFVPLPKAVEEAVTNGLKMMDRCYEKVLLNLEDSDDEDENESGQKHVVCRPRDPYLNRPLPHLIGSSQWNEKWHIGLIESDEEVLSDEDPEEFSQSSSDEEDSISNSPQTSNAPTTSESEFVAPSSAFIPREDLFRRLSDDVEEKSPLFMPDDTKHRDKVKVLPTVVLPSTRNDGNSESISKPKQLTEPPVPSSEQPKQTIFVQQRKAEPKFLNLFDDETPPPLSDEPTRSERKPVNLFLDSDEDDDLVSSTKRPSSIFNNNVASRPALPFAIPQVDNASNERDKSKSSFFGDVDNNNVPAVPRSEIKPTSKSNDFGGLFDDEPVDDFFDIIVREKSGKVDSKTHEKPKLQSKTVNLFGSDDDDDDDFDKIIGTTKKSDSKVPVSVKANESVPAVKRNEKVDISHSPYNSPFRPNTGPPSSYVSFLDDESPGFDDDIDEKSERKQDPPTPKQPPPRQSLFDDSPSDDPVIPPVTTNRKSPAKIIYDDIAETLQETKPIISIKPPPDGVIVKAPPVALPRKSPPKPIDDKIADSAPISTEEKQSDTRDETDQTSSSFQKNLSLFSNPEATTLPIVEKDAKPRPNKLKRNFNINVAALLPGAKLPSQKQSATVKEDRMDEPEPEESQTIENVSRADTVASRTVTPQIDSSNSDTTGRLTCLSKNRAKIQIQRKPSTRSGRQNLYKKTLISESEDGVPSVETTDSSEQPTDPEVETPKTQKQVIDVDPLENASETDVEDSDWLSEATTHDQPPELESDYSNSNVAAVDNDDEEEDWLKTIDEKPSSPNKTNLYDDDWLSPKEVSAEPKPSSQNLSHVMNYDWLTASSLPPEDINPPSNYSIEDDDHEQDDWLTSYASKDKTPVVADLPNDDDDWLITSEQQTKSRGVVAAVIDADDWLLEATSQSEKNVNAMAEEDNEDWLTKPLALPKASTSGAKEVNESPVEVLDDRRSDTIKSKVEKTSNLKATLFDSDDEVADVPNHNQSKSIFGTETSNILESKTETKSFLNSTLFDDDDDVAPTIDSVKSVPVPDVSKQSPPKMDFGVGSSDIFESKTEKKKSLNSTLFDDYDDDDDLFTSISQQKPVAKQATITATTNAVKATKSVSIKTTGKSLFSDDDNSDPDDLFGTTTKKSKGKADTGTKPKVSKPVRTGLFDDEDDDDEDIFAPKAQKQRVMQTETKKKPSITKSVASIPASNDPLADLLK